MPSVTLITNIPAPYREKVHELISTSLQGNYTVIYCAKKESNRKWNIKYGNYNKMILTEINENAIHNNTGIIKILNKMKPDVVIIMGFYPTMLYSFLWTLFKNKKLLVFTDGTLKSENSLTFVHRVIRKILFKKTSAFIGSANGAADLYKSYNIPKEKFFRTYLCIDNQLFYTTPYKEKKYDLMFSGQFIERKMPFFFIKVAEMVKAKLGNINILILGDGVLKDEIIKQLEASGLQYHFPGFIAQEELPRFYSESRLFLFPTQNDPWGVVVNEAMAAGVPVVTCENAGVANDLVLHNENGFILPLHEQVWADKVVELLSDRLAYDRLSQNAKAYVQKYNFTNAANGILDAISFTLKK